MPLIDPALLACAPAVAPTTLTAVVRVESDGDPLRVNINGLRVQPPRPTDTGAAVRLAERFIRLGYSVDLGLMQVNNRNLPALRLTIAQVLDPCTNLHSGATVLAADYAEAARRLGPGQPALLAALSDYNTGDFRQGFANGYVARYVSGLAHALSRGQPAMRTAPPDPYSAGTSIYLRESIHVRIE